MKEGLGESYPCDSAVKWDFNSLEKNVKRIKTNNLPPFGLKRVEIQPTSLCQYKCPFCYGINFKNKKKEDLSLDIIENNVFKGIRDNRKLSKDDPLIILSGLYSEPFLHSHSVELIRLLGKYNFRFAIYTNGVLMDDNIMEAICESARKVKNKGINYISFNLTGAVTNGCYEELIKKIEQLVEKRNRNKSPLQINVPVLLEDDVFSEEYLDEIQGKLLEIGVDKIRYSVPQVAVSEDNVVNTDNVQFLNNLKKKYGDKIYMRSKSNKRFDRCYVMANTISIDHKGNVYPCSQTCSSFFAPLSYGCIKEKRIEDIWNGKEHKRLFYDFEAIPTYCRCNSLDDQFNSVCSVLFWIHFNC